MPSVLAPPVNTRRFWLAALVSVAVVLSAPFIGELRAWLTSTLGRNSIRVMNGGIGAAVAGAAVLAVARIRDRRLLRYGLLVVAAGIAFIYGRGNPTASALTRAVERFHFLEYGLVTLLFYRAYRVESALGDRGSSPFVLSVLSALIVGTAEEGLQWFIPDRVGELRDVLLNLAAIACGLLVVVAVDPPRVFSWRLRGESRALAARVTAVTILALAVFIRVVHLGGIVADGEVAFRSRSTAAELATLAADRAAMWRTAPPSLRAPALSREDQYLTEALWHVQARNTEWAAGAFAGAWGENRILEKYFAPVLGLGHAWPVEHRADAARRVAGRPLPYESDAERLPIWPWAKSLFWLAVVVLVTPIAWLGRRR